MVLESTMILLDSSEFMRNGDYIPTRMEAQHDAANLLCGAKINQNPENTVGVLTMSSPGTGGANLLVSPTDDMGKLLSALHQIPITGEADVASSVQVAHLALKHRRNKNGGQRVIVFVGSPVLTEDRVLTRAGRMLKKNNVAVDVILMGETEDNENKMKLLVDAANSGDNSHLVTIPTGVLPSDILVGSPIVHGGNAPPASAAGGDGAAAPGESGGGGYDFGVDPNMDPELAMALRVSMEEERARQERASAAARESAAEESKEGGGETMESVPVQVVGTVADDEEDMLLQQALAMSMNESAATGSDGAKEDSTATAGGGLADEEMEMQRALQMSMGAGVEGTEGSSSSGGQFRDPQFVNQLLGSVPGVDPNDPVIRNAMGEQKEDNDAEMKDSDDSKKEG
uniref:26S proteasome regulatory subunit RPN10 n=2 Tax=Corethron hystrix TaxID=216773 RepID=A0A7S1B541_9STRA|mmetsp:Transcript_13328/g.29391  ORF Transcript_13328/g.29391 Transcript_13328/m.29391 type:complete len:400 (+) Transcript_13328:192-1391(+)